MSKKEQLLTENQVRQFMKLANLRPLTPGFIHGLGEGTTTGEETESGEEAYEDPSKGEKLTRSGKGRGEKKGDEAYVNEAADDDPDAVEESHGRGRGETDAGHGSPDARDDKAGARLREEDEYDEFEEENAEDDLEHAEDLEADAAEDLGDVGLESEGGGREVSVDDFLAALEVALESVLGDEVEVDQEEDVEEEEVVDLEGGDEMELEMGAVEEDPALQEMISTITKRVAKRIVKEALQKKK